MSLNPFRNVSVHNLNNGLYKDTAGCTVMYFNFCFSTDRILLCMCQRECKVHVLSSKVIYNIKMLLRVLYIVKKTIHLIQTVPRLSYKTDVSDIQRLMSAWTDVLYCAL